MALIHEWKIETVAAADNDPVASWPATVGGINLNQPIGAAQPLYKTNILPSGKAALRFDGINDGLSSLSTIAGAVHFFLVGAWRPATNPGSYGLWLAIGNGGPFFMNGVDLRFYPGPTHYRDGIDTLAVYPSGKFALYEAVVPGALAADVPLVANSGGGNPGTVDISYIGLYDAEQTGGPLTAIRDALTAAYFAPPPASGSGGEPAQHRGRRGRANRGR